MSSMAATLALASKPLRSTSQDRHSMLHLFGLLLPLVWGTTISSDTLLGDDDIELLFLHDILRNLPSLQSISILVDHAIGISPDDLPPFYQKLRGDTCGTLPEADLEAGEYSFADESRSAKQALVASHSLRQSIRQLEIIGGNWEHITTFEPEGKHLCMLKPLISGLHSLNLDNRLWAHPALAFLMTNLGTILNMATSLTELYLGFESVMGGIPFTEGGDIDDEPCDSILELLDSTPWAGQKSDWGRKLRTLKLDGLLCRRHELIRLLKRASSTLRSLSLTELTLVKDRDSESKPCLVSMMEDIRSATTLNDIYLHDNFTNSGAQQWIIESWHRPGQRRRRDIVQDWILGKVDTCPLDFLRVVPPAHDFTQKQFDAQLADFDASWAVEGDYLRYGDGTDSENIVDDYGSDWDIDTTTDDDAGNVIPPPVVLPALETEMGTTLTGLHPNNTYDWLADDVD